MKLKLLVLSLTIFLLGSFAEVQFGFKGYKVYRLILETQKQLDFLNQVNEALQFHEGLTDELQIWTDLGRHSVERKQPVLIMVSPSLEREFLRAIDQENFKHQVTISDLAVAIEEESEMSPADKKMADNGNMTWTAYHSYATIETFIESLAINYPDLVEKTLLGLSYEGRNVYLLKLGKPRPDGKTKPAIWMDSQIHAREWIASATLTFIVNKLVTEYATNSTCRRMLDEIDWYVLPVVNVDGFEYSHASPSNRNWRKSRRLNPFSTNVGADPNRNYDYKWMFAGADQTPSSDIYAGAYPFSEVENIYLTDAVLKHRTQIKALLTLHSFSQFWLTPWGYDDTLPDGYYELKNLGIKAITALKSLYGTKYDVGSSTEMLSAAAGATDDWGKAKGMIKYAYTVELRDDGRYGFVLPPNQIIPSGLETFEAINVVAKTIHSEFGPTLDE